MIGHDNLYNSLKIEGVIIADSPLYIGSGQSGIRPAAVDLEFIKLIDSNGNVIPYIPGSSLKGVIRGAAERIINTLNAQGLKIYSCDITANPCINGNRKEEIDKILSSKDYTLLKKKLDEYLCAICRIFGNTVYRSHVTFVDALGIKYSYGMRPGVAISRTDGSVAFGPFFVEYVNPGSEFSFQFIGSNLELYQYGLIATVINEINKGHIKLGGLKSRGLGKIKFRFHSIEYTNFSKSPAYELDLPMKSKASTPDAQDEFTNDVLGKLMELWKNYVTQIQKA